MAGKFSIRKASSNANEGYTETVEYKVLHCGNVEGNNNKFYCIEIQKNTNGDFRLFTHYGRLGSSNIYEIRDSVDGNPITDLSTAQSEMEKIVKKKLKGKTKKDKDGNKYTENYEEVDVVAPSVGSENIHKVAKKSVAVNTSAAIDTSSYDKEAARILDQVIDENVHSITQMTSLKLTANGFETPLGPVTKQHCDKARQPLDLLNKNLNKKGEIKKITDEVVKAQNLYFSLIPHDFGRKITDEDWILDSQKLSEAYDMLDQLETAVSMGNALQSSQAQRMDALGSDLELLPRGHEWDRIENYIRSSKAGNHRSSNVWQYKVKNIFKLRIPDERKRYEKGGKNKGNVEEVFHGSANSNILSISKNGLIIPPVNAAHVCGRMFGNGVYGAINSTKSLNYSIGFWGGRKTKYNNAFLFIMDMAMGKTQEVYSQKYNGADGGYDSVWAKKGRSLYNDELIVYNLNQVTIKYLVEMIA
jgi:poly [ADP-ribose] polymerase